jgi:hypothetical protein
VNARASIPHIIPDPDPNPDPDLDPDAEADRAPAHERKTGATTSVIAPVVD